MCRITAPQSCGPPLSLPLPLRCQTTTADVLPAEWYSSESLDQLPIDILNSAAPMGRMDGNRSDVLIGGSGGDMLFGGHGRNLIVGILVSISRRLPQPKRYSRRAAKMGTVAMPRWRRSWRNGRPGMSFRAASPTCWAAAARRRLGSPLATGSFASQGGKIRDL